MNISKLTNKIETIRKFEEMPLYFSKHINPYLSKYFSNIEFKKYSKFAIYAKKSLINKSVLYESSLGDSIEGNAYALFEFLLNDPNHANFNHIWALNNLNDFKCILNKYKNYDNVKFVEIGSEQYIKYLARSKYVISDSTFPDYYFRRKGQVYINCWSNTPFNVMGKHEKLDPEMQGKIQRNFLNASFLIHPNDYSINQVLSAYDVINLVEGNILDIGHPRTDLLFRVDESRLKNDLNISESDKVILYAPEWDRKVNLELYVAELINNIEDFNKDFAGTYKFIVKLSIRLHKLIPDSLKHLIVSDIDVNELLAITDILITNSSISFDFLSTNKPIIYFVDDFDEFNSFISLDQLPGPLCYNTAQVRKTVHKLDFITKEYENRYEKAIKKFNYNNDGNVCKRIFDAVFNGKLDERQYKFNNNKKNILFYPGSLKTNGITSSFSNLLNNFDYEYFNVYVIVYFLNKKKENYDDIINNLRKLNKNAKIIYISKGFNFLPKEYYYHNFIFKNGIPDAIKTNIPKNLYNREIRRLMGNTRFDIFIDFGGYDRYISLLFAFSKIPKKCIYLHSNMVEEYKLRFKTLSVIFDLYEYYDKLVTVSEDSKKANSANFKDYGINLDDKLTYVHNTIDFVSILEKAEQGKVFNYNSVQYYLKNYVKNDYLIDIDGIAAPLKNNINFIAIGRISPEKDHKKLLIAFSKVLKYYGNIMLYILGDGPLKESLINFAENIGISDKVIFTGHIKNPYWLLNKCQCMVQSSNYEGQPIVILEAMALGKNIISTDIKGPRKMLQGGYGQLVDNNADSLAKGMIDFIEDSIDIKYFDHQKYNKLAMDQFYKEVCE